MLMWAGGERWEWRFLVSITSLPELACSPPPLLATLRTAQGSPQSGLDLRSPAGAESTSLPSALAQLPLYFGGSSTQIISAPPLMHSQEAP